MDTGSQNQLALILQGGGALGAYQAGVYEALHVAGLEPDWVAGVSIGAVNGAIIAGNPRDRRLERLRAFWEQVTARPEWPLKPADDMLRQARNIWSALFTVALGQPGFFDPRWPSPLLAPPGTPEATSLYNTAPLRETLLRLVDFDLLNSGTMRFAAGATNVESGNFAYFDNAETDIAPEHIMASGALPPALPMVRIGDQRFWDGCLVSNTPLTHLLDHLGSRDTLVFEVDLFNARGPLPRDIQEAMGRIKDIQYSSRTRLAVDMHTQRHAMRLRLRALLDRMPEAALTADDRALRRELADMPEVAILLLIYQQSAWEGEVKDYEFSASSMREHWAAGRRDTERTLARKDWLAMSKSDAGIVVRDIHRAEGDVAAR